MLLSCLNHHCSFWGLFLETLFILLPPVARQCKAAACAKLHVPIETFRLINRGHNHVPQARGMPGCALLSAAAQQRVRDQAAPGDGVSCVDMGMRHLRGKVGTGRWCM